MIDFRYHLVSLISVFLALAVGIALGAGPLKETIGDTLTGQVEQLRTEKDDLRSQLEQTSSDLADAGSYIDAAGSQLVDGALEDRRVAVVALGEVPEDERSAVDARLEQSGATVTAHATLTEAWFDADLRSYRQALAGLLTESLDPPPADDATLDEQLAEALVQGLAGADPAAPDTLTADATNILAILSQGDNPMISLADPVTTGADAVVVLAVPVEPDEGDETSSPTPEAGAGTVDAQVAVVQAAQDLTEGAVLVDGPRSAGSLVETVLSDDALAAGLTTVSGADEAAGQVNVPLALAARIGGVNGHYGFGDGETVIPEAVQLTPVDRTPVVVDPQLPDGEEGEEGSTDPGADASADPSQEPTTAATAGSP